jgi:5-methylcytosine-specific restriction endonuclease McrA
MGHGLKAAIIQVTPRRAASVCGQPGCWRAAPPGQSRCAQHRRRKGWRWRRLRQAKLEQQPRCACGQLATQVHHRRPVAWGGDELPPLTELEAVCDRCHRERHRRAH